MFKEHRDEFDRVGFMEIDFGTMPKVKIWDESFMVVKRYLRANNYCYPPMDVNKCKNSLERKVCSWILKMRFLRNVGASRMTPYKIRKLNTIGFVWDWKTEFAHLVTMRVGGTVTAPIQKLF